MAVGVVMVRLYSVSGSHSATAAADSSPTMLSACTDKIVDQTA